jgi:hypothetical protein
MEDKIFNAINNELEKNTKIDIKKNLEVCISIDKLNEELIREQLQDIIYKDVKAKLNKTEE